MDRPGFFADIAFAHNSADREHLPCLNVNDEGLRLTRLMSKSHVNEIGLRRHFHHLAPVCAALVVALPDDFVAIYELEIERYPRVGRFAR